MSGIQKHTGNFIYQDNQLSCILTPEGRALHDGSGGFEYQYYLKDHLGNTRILFDQNKTVLQNYSYYPFGMEMGGFDYMATSTLKNKYLYNGKELQDDFGLEWYDYGARFYDPQLGRWYTIDPAAEIYNSFTPYNYGLNNPILFIDANGLASSYSWVTQRYEDEDGNEVSWEDVKSEYRIGNSNKKDGDGKKDKNNKLVPASLPTSFSDLLSSIGESFSNLLGLNIEEDDPNFYEKKKQTAQNTEQAIIVIETINGVLSFIVPFSSVSELAAKIEAGHGLAALATVPFVALDMGTGGKGSRSPKLGKLARKLVNWLGPESKAFLNDAKDIILLSKDETKRVRFDINKTWPHKNIHTHVEELIDGKWKKSGPLYPKDVPNN